MEPLFWNGDLWLSMGWGTRKAMDLDRDARVLVHSIVTNRNGTTGEYKLRGHAIAEQDPHLHREYAAVVAAQLGWQPEPGRFHLFRVDIDDVTFIRWDDANNDQYVATLAPRSRVRTTWYFSDEPRRPRGDSSAPRIAPTVCLPECARKRRGHNCRSALPSSKAA